MDHTPPPISNPKKKSKAGCLIGAGVFILLALALVGFIFNGLAKLGSMGGTADSYPETLVEGNLFGDKKIAVIRVEGVIESGGDNSMAEVAIGMLKQARLDDSVKAVVVRVNSPGGGVTASDEIYHEMNKVREAGKPVVVYMETLAASGGYYIACAADEVIANETTLTGSIGVIIASYNVSGLMDKVGVQPMVFKSGDFKDMLSPTREMRPEEQEYVQSMVMESYEKFLGLVSDARGISKERLRDGIADGRIISGAKAKELGLVDSNGYLDDAIAAAKSRAGGGEFSVVAYKKLPSIGDLIGFGAEAKGEIEVNISPQFLPELKPGVPYLLPSEYAGSW